MNRVAPRWLGLRACVAGIAVAAAATSSAGGEEAERTGAARFFPGADSAGHPRSRKPTAVLLFAPPASRVEVGALGALPPLRLQPVVCVLRGRLATGARCGEAMPARVRVRLTDAGGAPAQHELEVQRSLNGFRDELGHHVYPAPYGPACCMYTGCVGKTVPYYPVAAKADAPTRPMSAPTSSIDQTILAVWPADAEIDLSIFAPGQFAPIRADDGPWRRELATGKPLSMSQTVQLRGRRYASLTERWLSFGLFSNLGSDWELLLKQDGVSEYFVLAASDLDADGRPELIVYARWANDYGLHVLANDVAKPLYSFSCGNI